MEASGERGLGPRQYERSAAMTSTIVMLMAVAVAGLLFGIVI